MPFEIVFAPEALRDFKDFEGGIQATIKKGIETHLRHQPKRTSKTRIKRLRGLRQPQFRLRIDQIRVFYDVDSEANRVEVLRISPKLLSTSYLEEEGIPDEDTTADES